MVDWERSFTADALSEPKNFFFSFLWLLGWGGKLVQ